MGPILSQLVIDKLSLKLYKRGGDYAYQQYRQSARIKPRIVNQKSTQTRLHSAYVHYRVTIIHYYPRNLSF